MIARGNTGSLGHVRALPIPTKPVGNIPPVKPRSGHKPIKCGTPRGYNRHRELGTTPCKDCLAAVEAKPLQAAKTIAHGTPAGWQTCRKTQGGACDACKAAKTKYNRDWRASRGQTERARGASFNVEAAQADRDAGMPTHDIAAKYGVSRQSIWRWTTGPHGKRPTAPYVRIDVARLRELWEQGMTDPQIAKVLGCDPSAVGRRRRMLKLKPHGRRVAS